MFRTPTALRSPVQILDTAPQLGPYLASSASALPLAGTLEHEKPVNDGDSMAHDLNPAAPSSGFGLSARIY
jgi:hypothetical protein